MTRRRRDGRYSGALEGEWEDIKWGEDKFEPRDAGDRYAREFGGDRLEGADAEFADRERNRGRSDSAEVRREGGTAESWRRRRVGDRTEYGQYLEESGDYYRDEGVRWQEDTASRRADRYEKRRRREYERGAGRGRGYYDRTERERYGKTRAAYRQLSSSGVEWDRKGDRASYTRRREYGYRDEYAGDVAWGEEDYGEPFGKVRREYDPWGERSDERREYDPRGERSDERREYDPWGERSDERREYEPEDGRRGAFDKRGYMEYQEIYHSSSKEDYLDSRGLIPEDKYKKRGETIDREDLYSEYSPPAHRESDRGMYGIYRLLNIFYEPFILNNFGIKLPVIQLIATLALFQIFNMSFRLAGPVWDLMIGVFGNWLGYFTPLVASLLGVVLGFFFTFYTRLRDRPKRVVRIGFIILALTVLLFLPLLNLIFGGWDVFLSSFIEMVGLLGRAMIFILYVSPVAMGVFAIWSRKGGWGLTLTSVMLMLGVVVSTNILDLMRTGRSTTSQVGTSFYFLYALILFVFIETRETSLKFYRYAQEIPDDPDNEDQVFYFNEVLNKYFFYLCSAVVLGSILVLTIYYRTRFLGALGSVRLAESLDLSSFFGLMVSMIVLFTLLSLLAIIWRHRHIVVGLLKRIKGVYTRYASKRREMEKLQIELERLRSLDQYS